VRRAGILIAAVALLAGCGGSHETTSGGTLTIAVNAPFSRSPYVGETMFRGAELAVREINLSGGVPAGKRTYRLRIRRLDNGLSPRRALDNVRRATASGAVAIVDEGTGVDASWRVARDAGIPVAITYQGGIELVDEDARPNVFRIAPTDRGTAFRLAEYLIPKGLKIALLTDDTGYGRHGGAALDKAFSGSADAVALRLALPATSSDLAPQMLRARRAGATALLVWAQASTIAKVLIAARGSGWDVPVYTPSAGEDPLVRQQLADHPEWIDGLTFASGRMTAEVGTAPWGAFQEKYEVAYGAEQVGVRTRAGKRVVQPPDYAMYSYDFVNVLAAALARAGATKGDALIHALEGVTVQGANGDERGFNENNHEGVVDDDVYFARFADMVFTPVKDDPLSKSLPPIEQRR
jgi:ABC-type branched-subunit amino acid transport system substrate-binding protein